MATFKATVLKNKVRRDGTYNVKIRVTHERKVSYISTEYYVKKKELTDSLELKQCGALTKTLLIIEGYTEKILKLSGRIHLYNAQELADWLVNQNKAVDIDFVKFSQEYINNIKKSRKGTGENLQTALWSLIDFFKKDKISVSDINSRTLGQFEDYLRTERKIIRYNSVGKAIKTTKDPLTNSGIISYMSSIRKLFNACRDEYNDEDRGDLVISHNPFKKYNIPKPPKTKKRNLPIAPIASIRDLEPKGKRMGLARDIFMLSFYLVGMNTVDLYNINQYKNGRLSYNRTKTKHKEGEAFISIKVEPEAMPIIERYLDKSKKRVFNFHKQYATPDGFNKAVNIGLKKIAEELNIDFDLNHYYARHSWATLARNKCRIHTDDISMALTHSVPEHKITDVYIEKDFTIIDEANRKVLDLLL